MKRITITILVLLTIFVICTAEDCESTNKTAIQEQARTEQNQAGLLATQPPPTISWSLERDNLIKRTKLQNDRSVTFFIYVFIEGVGEPVGYYQVNKVSSVNSQLTNPEQVIYPWSQSNGYTVPSPAEDGSYGTNGEGVFAFTPEDIYIESNMHYIAATVPLTFTKPVNRLAIINTEEAKQLLTTSKAAMAKP